MGTMRYEVARRFGNHRVARTVALADFGEDSGADTRGWGHMDGAFDVAALGEGLRAMDWTVVDEDGAIVVETEIV